MKNSNVYALLVSVGDYEASGLKNLPTYKGDPVLLGTSLTLGLNVPQDHIRIITGDERPGFVRTATFARAISEMKYQLGKDDTFILYYSGHGKTERTSNAQTASNLHTPSPSTSIVLSDGEIELQSVIDYMDHIPAGAKIVILDCCYSGGFQGAGPRRLDFDSVISEFAGKGIAIIASSSADEIARTGPGGEYSVFTIMLAHSIAQGHAPLQEKVSLADIYGSMMELMEKWNAENTDKQQHPVFRSSIGGTIYFRLRERTAPDSAVQKRSFKPLDNAACRVQSFKPLDNASEKRIAVFAVVDKSTATPWSLSQITREIANRVVPEQDVIWCYFGYDASDIRRGLHIAYTIWCRSDALRAKYYHHNQNSSVVDGIYLFQNNSYAILKDMQRTVKAHEVIEADYKRLLALIVTEAEKFVYDLQEVRNRIMPIEQMRASYVSWISKVKSLYICLSEEEAAPDDLYDWTEAILDLAGWVVDLAVLFEGNRTGTGALTENERWLIDHSIRRYYEAVEKLKNM